MHGERFQALTDYIRKQQRSQIQYLRFYLTKLENKWQIILKIGEKEKIKIWTEISEIQNRKTEKITNTQHLYFDKINKFNQSLPTLMKEREETQITNISNKKRKLSYIPYRH